MSRLTLYREDDPANAEADLQDGADIAAALADVGVRFERWPLEAPLARDASDEDVLAAYAVDIARLSEAGGYRSVDVIRLASDHPERAAMRSKFLSEHRHDEDEVRFFVEGAGLFCLREARPRPPRTLCEAGDLLWVPARRSATGSIPGRTPHFTVDPLLHARPEGWVAPLHRRCRSPNGFPRSTSRRRRDGDARDPDRHRRHDEQHRLRDGNAVPLRPRAPRLPIVAAHADAEALAAGRLLRRGAVRARTRAMPVTLDLLRRWIDEDRKATPLKDDTGPDLGGGLCGQAALRGHVYPGCGRRTVRRWHGAGHRPLRSTRRDR